MTEQEERIEDEAAQEAEGAAGPGRRKDVSPGPGALGCVAQGVTNDLWNLPADAFAALVSKALAGQLQNLEGDL